jgi:hypothetical protein
VAVTRLSGTLAPGTAAYSSSGIAVIVTTLKESVCSKLKKFSPVTTRLVRPSLRVFPEHVSNFLGDLNKNMPFWFLM